MHRITRLFFAALEASVFGLAAAVGSFVLAGAGDANVTRQFLLASTVGTAVFCLVAAASFLALAREGKPFPVVRAVLDLSTYA